MWKRRKVERALAASLYDEADDQEKELLAKAMEQSPELRSEAEAYRRFLDGIPDDSGPELPFDLLPEVRRRIALEAPEPVRSPRAGWRLAAFSAASLAVVLAFGAVMNNAMAPVDTPMAASSSADAASSVLAGALRDAREHVAKGEYTTAYQQVEEALAAHGDDAHAADAQLFLADLAFDELHWYDRAEAAYDAYRQGHSTDFTMAPQSLRNRVAFRLDLLAETRDEEYEPLHLVEAAALRGPEALSELENLLARADGVYLSALVSREMAYAVDPAARTDDTRLVQAMETVRNQCERSGAVARLDYEIGAASYEVLDNPAKAREHLTLAAESGEGDVSARARAYLARLAP